MFADPEVGAIIAHTGGFPAMSVLDRIDYDLIGAHPKPFIGYSDNTLYHLAFFARCGLVGFHADTLTDGLGRAVGSCRRAAERVPGQASTVGL